jgi:hypothetical protein
MNVPKPAVVSFALLVVLLMGLNVALARRDQKLAGLNKAYEANFHLGVGDAVPSLYGTGLDGSRVTVGYKPGQSKTLLLVFAHSCTACMLNSPAWRRLLTQTDSGQVRLIGVSLEGTLLPSQYLAQLGLANVQATLIPDASSIISYRFRYTPQTILIGPNSKVEGIWSGVLEPGEITEIERAIAPLNAGAISKDRAVREQ